MLAADSQQKTYLAVRLSLRLYFVWQIQKPSTLHPLITRGLPFSERGGILSKTLCVSIKIGLRGLSRVHLCNLNPMFYIVDSAVVFIGRYYPKKPRGSGYKPEPAKGPSPDGDWRCTTAHKHLIANRSWLLPKTLVTIVI